MKYLAVFVVFTLFILPAYAQQGQEEDYITVAFTQTATPNVWTNENLNSTVVDVDVDVSSRDGSNSWTEDRGSTRYRITENYTDTTTRTETTTTVTTQTAVFLTVSFLDLVNSQGAFESDEEFQNSWFRAWESNANARTNRTFQIREDSREKIEEGVQELNTMYNELFDLQNRIATLFNECEAYCTSPAYDKEQPNLMDELTKLRKEEYALKQDIIAKRESVYSEQGSGPYGWVLNTTSTTDIDTTTNRIVTSVTETVTEHGICFVANTSFADGSVLGQMASVSVLQNGNAVNCEVVETGFYSGVVFMFYDAAGNPLLPGSVTPNHWMVYANKTADQIEVGDMLLRGTNEAVRVARIELSYYEGYTYNVANDCAPFSFTETNYAVTLGVSR